MTVLLFLDCYYDYCPELNCLGDCLVVANAAVAFFEITLFGLPYFAAGPRFDGEAFTRPMLNYC